MSDRLCIKPRKLPASLSQEVGRDAWGLLSLLRAGEAGCIPTVGAHFCDDETLDTSDLGTWEHISAPAGHVVERLWNVLASRTEGDGNG